MANERPLGSYEAGPGDVGRVLLLYSGGLDTSVMLKWIQDEYGAEVATLTLNLGQPGEDYGVIEGKARTWAPSSASSSTRARSSPRSMSCPRSRRTRSTAAATRSSRRSGGR